MHHLRYSTLISEGYMHHLLYITPRCYKHDQQTNEKQKLTAHQ